MPGSWKPKARSHSQSPLPRAFVVANHFVDDEAEEFLAEFRVELGIFGQRAQAGDLRLFPARIGGGQGVLRLVCAHRLRDAESLRQNVNQRGIEVVDRFAICGQSGIGCGIWRGRQL